MALSDDNLDRDPHLARLVAAAGDEAPSPALDAAILAAARRAVSAGPQAVTPVGGGETAAPAPRRKRNGYVPVSIAAVLVMSASLVTIVQQEKGDDLMQPPPGVPAPAPVPSATAPVPDAKVSTQDTAPGAKPDTTTLRDAPAKLKRDSADLADAASATASAKEDYANKLRKPVESALQRKADTPADAAKDASGDIVRRGAPPAPAEAEAEASRSGVAAGAVGNLGSAAPAPPQPPAAPAAVVAPVVAPVVTPAVTPAVTPIARASRAEPFPAAREDTSARLRAEADRSAASARGAIQSAPMVPESASAPVARQAETRSAVGAREFDGAGAAKTAPTQAAADAPVAERVPAPASVVASVAKPAASPPPPPVWRGLDDQPVEKWLERAAEFKRDGRAADLDALMTELRRRFPHHPASAR